MKINKAAISLSALAQESRLTIFQLLCTSGDEGLSAGVIAEELHIPSATLSFHLSQLHNAGLVDSHRVGRMIFYSVNYKKVKRLASFLTENIPSKKPKEQEAGIVEYPSFEGE